MTVLKGEHIQLRALEPEDLEYLFALENDPDIWEISGTLTLIQKSPSGVPGNGASGYLSGQTASSGHLWSGSIRYRTYRSL